VEVVEDLEQLAVLPACDPATHVALDSTCGGHLPCHDQDERPDPHKADVT
jgi:hypothetical protein